MPLSRVDGFPRLRALNAEGTLAEHATRAKQLAVGYPYRDDFVRVRIDLAEDGHHIFDHHTHSPSLACARRLHRSTSPRHARARLRSQLSPTFEGVDDFDNVLGSGRTTNDSDRSEKWWLEADGSAASLIAQRLDEAYEQGYDLLYIEYEPRRVLPADPAGYVKFARSFNTESEMPSSVLSADGWEFIASRWPKYLQSSPQRMVLIGPMYASAPAARRTARAR